jgi:hypothetical protein
MDSIPNPPPATKRKAVELTDEDLYAIDEGLLHNVAVFDPDHDQASGVHSSGLSPAEEAEEVAAEEEEDVQTPGGIVMPQGSPLTMDDFFDLDEAAIAPSPLAI